MNEKANWPEPLRFSPNVEPRQWCAEITVEILLFARDETVSGPKSMVVSNYADALDIRDGRYHDALRLTQCAYAKNPPIFASLADLQPSDSPQDAWMFTLQHGELDTSKYKDFDIGDTDESEYVWRHLACIVVDVSDAGQLDGTVVTLLDARDGRELNDDEVIHLQGMLEALYEQLRTQSFKGGLLVDSLEEVPLEDNRNEMARLASMLTSGQYTEFQERCPDCGNTNRSCQHHNVRQN